MILMMNHSLKADLSNPLKRSGGENLDDGEQVPNKRLRTTVKGPQQHQDVETSDVNDPNKHDVLSGRGGLINKHPGNVAFRRVVEANKQTYHSCKKEHKLLLAISIVEAVGNQTPAGRFLTQDKDTGRWINVGRVKAIQKTSQALREGAEKIRSSLVGESGTTSEDVELNELSVTSEKKSPRRRKYLPTQEEINIEVLRRAVASDPEETEQPQVAIVVPPPPAAVERAPPVNSATRCVSTELTVQHSTSEPQIREQRLDRSMPSVNTSVNSSVVVQQEDNVTDAPNSQECLPDMDAFDFFSDDTMFENLEEDGLDFIMNLPLSPSSRVVDVYAGVEVVGPANDDEEDAEDEVLMPGVTTTPCDDNSVERRTGGAQSLNRDGSSSEPSSSDDGVSVVSIDICAKDEELLSSSEDDDREDLLMTSLIPGLSSSSEDRAIWEL